jgi:hypothetical protein
MNTSDSLKRRSILIVGAILAFFIVVILSSLIYVGFELWAANNRGVHPSAKQAMLENIDVNYSEPYEAEIIYPGTNSFDSSNPQIWYVIACVWADARADGPPVGSEKNEYDQPGSFYLNTQDGWVRVPEGGMPGILGFWMKFYGLAVPGSPVPSTNFGDPNQSGRCEF